VALKVINAKTDRREDLRLFPVSEEGELVSITVSPHDARATKTPDELHRIMAERLAVEVGHLFRDYEMPRPEDRPH
jgi:hypothetical protein